jgi:threonine synthase
MASFVRGLHCSRCRRGFPAGVLHTVCPDPCGSPLVVDYDFERVGRAVGPEEIARRSPDMWRYRELLPPGDPANVVSLGEGFTPLLALPGLGSSIGLPDLWVKDDGLNPTGTFKARGAACGVSMAVELGISEVALPSAGNAGAAWAAYGAAAGLRVHVAMPRDAPEATRLECLLYGAQVELVDGLISDAGRIVAEWVRDRGWMDASTLREPYRIEGKKTLGFEIAEQLGWRAPDAIVYPAGGGVGIIGIHLALGQLRELGWLEGPLTRLIVTQSTGCAPIVKAFDEGREESEPWPDAATIAAGLRVPKALGDVLVLRAVRETGGTAVAVPDAKILAAMNDLARAAVLAAPEGAATLAAARALRGRGDLSASDRVVLINTGSALKYPEAMRLAAAASASER